jgi:hypothetical protein
MINGDTDYSTGTREGHVSDVKGVKRRRLGGVSGAGGG